MVLKLEQTANPSTITVALVQEHRDWLLWCTADSAVSHLLQERTGIRPRVLGTRQRSLQGPDDAIPEQATGAVTERKEGAPCVVYVAESPFPKWNSDIFDYIKDRVSHKILLERKH